LGRSPVDRVLETKEPALEDAHAEPRTALIFGGTSEIALAIANKLTVGRLRQVVVAVRDPSSARVAEARAELEGAGATVHVVEFDAVRHDQHEAVVANAVEAVGDLDLVMVAHGQLGDQESLVNDPVGAAALVDVNFAGAVSAGLAAAAQLRSQGHGRMLLISSVAAVRPRASNYLYGSTKAGLDAFGRGLSDDLEGTGVRVSVLRPGFVRTRMTDGMEEQPFSADPVEVAEAAVVGLLRGRRVIWAPAPLQGVFGVLSVMPGPIWRKISKR
jgi:decaprenylphospho-beta-D-erythro-pentofuranosid-2-ulose 2-reductase